MNNGNEGYMNWLTQTWQINGTEYWLCDSEKGWVWVSDKDESPQFRASPLEALQDAINHEQVRAEKISDEKPYWITDEECTNPVWHEVFGGVNLPKLGGNHE